MTDRKTAIIVAGGRGERMQSALPKQFIELAGRPILMHAIEAFARFDAETDIIVVLPETQIGFWKELCSRHRFTLAHRTTGGGDTRFHSVARGLALAAPHSLVAVHDGVRPFVSRDTLERCFACAAAHGTAVPVVDVVDSVRRVETDGSRACDRSLYRLVQTPQVFDAALLCRAYRQAFSPAFTDDASVVEAFGGTIHLVEGNRENIKLTTPFDLAVGETVLRLRQEAGQNI